MLNRVIQLCLILFVNFTFAQNKHIINYPNEKIHIEYHTQNGLFNGTYTSYYENGKKKAEGEYLDNQRKGYWRVWDAKGNKRIERFFENSLDAKIVVAWDTIGTKRKAKPFGNVKYSSVDPVLGYIPYYPIKQEDVVWSKRLWRIINSDSSVNVPLFEQNKLFAIIYNGLKNNEIKAYSDDEFQNTLTYDSIKKYEVSNIFEYRIKEDLFYNKAMNIAEIRIIGICPVIKVSGKTKTIFWLYYPEIRSLLSKNKLEKNISNTITNYENIFSQRYFNSIVFKESNLHDREIKDYKKGKDIQKEYEMIEMNAIDYEFEFWFKYIIYRVK